jgi:hypothetical protein
LRPDNAARDLRKSSPAGRCRGGVGADEDWDELADGRDVIVKNLDRHEKARHKKSFND